MTCRHENADPDPRWLNLGDAEVSAIVEQFRCIDCGAWLSLGPSNDCIPRDELRLAVMLACHFADDRPCRCFSKRELLDRATEREIRDAVEEATRKEMP